MSDSETLLQIRKWAKGLVNCGHQLCSLNESYAEEMYGQQVLDILDASKEEGESVAFEACMKEAKRRMYGGG